LTKQPDQKLTPLILVSAAVTAFVLVPLLHLGDKRQDEPAGAMPAGAAVE
jgi:hypothetical protein